MIYLNKKIISFIVGIFSMTQVRAFGTFAISEFIVFVMIVYFILNNPRSFQALFKNRKMIILLILCFLWACTSFFSDQVNGNNLEDSLKGIGGIVPLFFCFIFFFWLFYDRLSVMNFFLWGVAISSIISLFILTPPVLQDMSGEIEFIENENLFSRSLASRFVSFVHACSFSGFSQYPFGVILLQLLIAFNALLQGSRGTFLLGLMGCSVLLYFIKSAKYHILPVRSSVKIKKMIPVFLAVMVLGGIAAKNVYEYVAINGYMGEANKMKYERQANSNLGLLSGRGEFVAASLAIADKPWLGHGSYPMDEDGYAVEAAELTGDTDFIDRLYNTIGEKQIPTHSHLTQAWVWHGILGAVFWIYALWLIIVYLYKYAYIYPKWIAYTIPASLEMIWQILFSPYQGRPVLGAFFAFIIIMMEQTRSGLQKEQYLK